jgi:UDP-glucuronate 4-epimerase
MKKIVVTGVAGFIGSKVADKLLEKNIGVIGIDNLNDYYDTRLKRWRLERLKKNSHFQFYQADIENFAALKQIFQKNLPEAVINLAARAGVRYSLENPFIYHSTNAGGNLNLLEMCKEFKIKKYILASTSSLYAGQETPFKEDLPVNNPISPYAATKKAAETMAYTYHYLYGIDVSIVRYFTVYGPAGRPDMSPFRFIKWIVEGTPLTIYGDGSQERDFTYVDDIAEGTIKALKPVGYEIINLGNNQPFKLSEMIHLIEKYTNKEAKYQYENFHKADMKSTWADISKANELLNWQPKINLEEGIKRTVKWTRDNWDWVKNIKV